MAGESECKTAGVKWSPKWSPTPDHQQGNTSTKRNGKTKSARQFNTRLPSLKPLGIAGRDFKTAALSHSATLPN
jgi:hypothetical protein